MYRFAKGFTLVEIMVVLAVIAILLTIALPSDGGRINRVRVEESLKLVEQYKAPIEFYYRSNQFFPASNQSANLPQPHQIVGNYLAETQLIHGALHLRLGNKIGKTLQGKIVSLRPIFVPGVENAPISWICGYDTVPNGMAAAGENLTDLDPQFLPLNCRQRD
jgi:type IV pilus assembly protein PilA